MHHVGHLPRNMKQKVVIRKDKIFCVKVGMQVFDV